MRIIVPPLTLLTHFLSLTTQTSWVFYLQASNVTCLRTVRKLNFLDEQIMQLAVTTSDIMPRIYLHYTNHEFNKCASVTQFSFSSINLQNKRHSLFNFLSFPSTKSKFSFIKNIATCRKVFFSHKVIQRQRKRTQPLAVNFFAK